jgi:acyl carrier protein
MSRSGLVPLSTGDGLALFDAALGLDEAFVVPTRWDLAAVRAQGETGPLVLRALAPVAKAAPAAVPAAGLRERLAGLPAAERERVVLDLVCGHAAAVLGLGTAAAIEADLPFKDIGYDSLTVVELRNRLNQATDLRLAPSLLFNHPTPARVTAFLLGELVPAPQPVGVLAELDRLEAALAGPLNGDRDEVTARLKALLSKIAEPEPGAGSLESASVTELLSFIDRELG